MIARRRIDARHRLFEAEQQRFVRRIEFRLAELGMGLGIEADGAHEAERFGDAVGEFAIASGLRGILDEAQHPAVRVVEVGVAAGGKGAQQVERRRRLTIGH